MGVRTLDYTDELSIDNINRPARQLTKLNQQVSMILLENVSRVLYNLHHSWRLQYTLQFYTREL